METRKLYYEDCHLQQFTARVCSCRQTEKGFEIILDATAFYPEGGGQACDLGTLGGAAVLDVQERGEEVVHLCDAPLTEGETVCGQIDYQRRFDLMQQHTGEHIISGLVHRRYGYHNVGFHMGADVITIDFDGPIPPEALREIEQEANQALWKNIPLHIWYPSKEELPQVGYRTKRALPWPVRIVEIPGYDKCACCGVHTATTGEVGLVKLFSCIKFKGGVRIEMACGGRALAYLSAVYEQNRQVSQAFSAKILETGEAARRMNEVLDAEKFKTTSLQRQIFGFTAEACRGLGNVLHLEPGLSAVQVRELADRIADVCGGIGGVCSSGADGRCSYCLVSRTEDLRAFGKELTGALQGRGGGKPSFQQGSLGASVSEISAFFKEKGWNLSE